MYFDEFVFTSPAFDIIIKNIWREIMLKISNIKIYEDLSDGELIEKVIDKYKIRKSNIINWLIIKN